ncbi:hypothetical protein RchiOBHm_Chr7g0234761 [Rosa chinensis]|uniref:Uncharacterized protein n=1 Tax=Rosa chinensis TaxID=74649 RepID=A0A2P6PGM1_ROSCH|nr:hypothetical protein RchiOBHm_Chr7g0234761 [Rosa chinensis]
MIWKAERKLMGRPYKYFQNKTQKHLQWRICVHILGHLENCVFFVARG